MRVLHLFDRYLNSTMNWAYHLLVGTPDTVQHITAPVLIDNQFLKQASFQIWDSPFQRKLPASEWEVPATQRWLSRIGSRHAWYRKNLSRRIRREGIELLHAHFAGVGWRALALARQTGLPLVVSFYGYDYEQLPHKQPVFKKRYQKLFRQAAALLTEGPHGAAILRRMGCPPEKIHIVPLGVRVDRIPFRDHSKMPGKLRLIQAATFTEKKGHIYSLKAVEAALTDCPNLHLTLLGEPQDQRLVKELKDYIAEHSLEQNVSFRPFVDPDTFHEFLNEFDIFIHPSCYAANRDCEGGAPIVLLDAQATGLPVISTRHCDIPQEVEHQRTGWLASERSVPELADGIRYFYRMSDTEYQTFRDHARKLVEERFNIQNSGITLASVYRQLLNKH